MPHLACLLRRLGDVDVHVRRSGLTMLERLATATLLSGEQSAAVALPLPEPRTRPRTRTPDPDRTRTRTPTRTRTSNWP